MDKKLRETTLFMCRNNERRQAKGKLGHVVQIDVNAMLNLSICSSVNVTLRCSLEKNVLLTIINAIKVVFYPLPPTLKKSIALVFT